MPTKEESTTRNLRVLVIGSGLSAYGCCLALLENDDVDITILDIGISSQYKGQPNYAVPNSVDLDGSYYPYGINDDRWDVSLRSTRICSSHALGGFSKVYSGSLLKPRDADMLRWPEESRPSIKDYNSVLSTLSIWQQKDELTNVFCCYPITEDQPTNRTTLVGSPRVALSKSNNSGGPYDCSYDFERWIQEGKIKYLSGNFVTHLEKVNDKVVAHAEGVDSRSDLIFDCVYVGAGCVNTTGIIDRSIWGVGKRTYIIHVAPTLLQLHIRAFASLPKPNLRRPTDPPLKSDFCKAFIEHRSLATRGLWCHTQVNSFNRTILKALREKLPAGVRELAMAMQLIFRFSITVFHSDLGIRAQLISNCTETGAGKLSQTLEVIETPMRCRRTLATSLRSAIMGRYLDLGLVPVPFGSFIADVMRGNRLGGWHYGGTLPMVHNPTKPTDLHPSGELSGMKGVYVIDASGFPSVPGSTVALLTMANAYRIAANSIRD